MREKTIPLDDGWTLIRGEDGKWHLSPAETAEVKNIDLIDLAVYGDGERYRGRRVRLIGRLYGAGVRSATIALPGTAFLHVDLSAVPRDVIKRLIQQCSAIETPASCTAEIVGNIGPNSGRADIHLTDVQIVWPRPSTTQ